MGGTLYLVGTPIGNLEDMTDRARRVLGTVDLVAAEDTRRTGRLLKAFGIRARLVSLFEANEAERVPELIAEVRAGRDVAVVSDAGMPGLSDPGYRVVAACVEAGVQVDVAPGPSAAVAALVISGLPTDRFVFEGFLPRSGRARRERLAALAPESRTSVLFESPRRLGATLRDLLGATGDRRVALVRELTKLHQEVVRGRLSEVLPQVEARELKGEVVLVLGGAGAGDASGGGSGPDVREATRQARELVAGGATKREAARRAREATGVPARTIYDALVRKDANGEGAAVTGPRPARGARQQDGGPPARRSP